MLAENQGNCGGFPVLRFRTPPNVRAALSIAAIGWLVLLVLNRAGVMRTTPYVPVGVVMWAAVLKSGVHATLAGVLSP